MGCVSSTPAPQRESVEKVSTPSEEKVITPSNAIQANVSPSNESTSVAVEAHSTELNNPEPSEPVESSEIVSESTIQHGDSSPVEESVVEKTFEQVADQVIEPVTESEIPNEAVPETINETIEVVTETVAAEISTAVPEESEGKPVDESSTTEPERQVAPTRVTSMSSPPLKQGFINKQGQGIIKNWRNRYFVLDGPSLTYYESKADLPPYGINQKGEIPTLKGKQIINTGNLQVKLTGGEARDIILQFPDETAMTDWVSALNQHIDYSNRTKS